MKMVSILMNCWNGEEYLEESIESVFNQSFSDWEIVFIDNCSNDKSAEIAMSFGKKVKYYKTPHKMTLGEARAFGVDKCKSQYLMYLDVDDRYRENTVDTLFDAIHGSNYVVVYSGHRNIDSKGRIIGKYNPLCKEGYIFDNLLLQFDIPTSSLIMNLKMYEKSGQTYDKAVVVSAEYNHYLRLAISHKFKCIKGELTDYRIHSRGLTIERAEDLYRDRITTLDNIIREYPETLTKYPDGFKEAYARADYYMMRNYLSKDNLKSAREVIKPHIFLSFKYFAVYIILYMPSFVLSFIFKLKYSR